MQPYAKFIICDVMCSSGVLAYRIDHSMQRILLSPFARCIKGGCSRPDGYLAGGTVMEVSTRLQSGMKHSLRWYSRGWSDISGSQRYYYLDLQQFFPIRDIALPIYLGPSRLESTVNACTVRPRTPSHNRGTQKHCEWMSRLVRIDAHVRREGWGPLHPCYLRSFKS